VSAGRFRVLIDPTSSAAVRAALDGVKRGVVNRVVKAAVARQARAASRIAKASAPRGPSGAFRRSLGMKFKSYRKAAVWVYLVGARFDVTGTDPNTGRRTVPAFYAHLAERGRRAVAAKKKTLLRFFPAGAKGPVYSRAVRPARGTPAITRAWRSVRSGAAAAEIERDVLAGLKRIAAAYAARGKSIYR
jgi:hypothetical protein